VQSHNSNHQFCAQVPASWVPIWNMLPPWLGTYPHLLSILYRAMTGLRVTLRAMLTAAFLPRLNFWKLVWPRAGSLFFLVANRPFSCAYRVRLTPFFAAQLPFCSVWLQAPSICHLVQLAKDGVHALISERCRVLPAPTNWVSALVLCSLKPVIGPF